MSDKGKEDPDPLVGKIYLPEIKLDFNGAKQQVPQVDSNQTVTTHTNKGKDGNENGNLTTSNGVTYTIVKGEADGDLLDDTGSIMLAPIQIKKEESK